MIHGHPERNGTQPLLQPNKFPTAPKKGREKISWPCPARDGAFFLKRRLLTNGDKCDIISELPYGKPRESSD